MPHICYLKKHDIVKVVTFRESALHRKRPDVPATPSRGVFLASAAGLAVIATAARAGADFCQVVAQEELKLVPEWHGLAQVFEGFLRGTTSLLGTHPVPPSH